MFMVGLVLFWLGPRRAADGFQKLHYPKRLKPSGAAPLSNLSRPVNKTGARLLNTLWIILLLTAGIIALAYTVVANLLRVWLDHRVRLALLEAAEPGAGHSRAASEVESLVRGAAPVAGRPPLVDHVTLGVTLAVIGSASALLAWFLGGRSWMAGAFLGGVACVAVGFLLTLLGLLMRYLSRLPVDRR